MNDLASPFKSPQGEAEYLSAYDATMRLWATPYEEIDLLSRFGSTHLVACGPKDAPPLVLLHCFFTSLTSWVNNIAALSRDHRVYAPDMMGQPSRSIPGAYIRTRDDMTEWLTGLLDRLEISQTDLIGYSYGGFTALNYAIKAPQRLKKLVLLSPVGGVIPLRTQFYIRGAVSGLAQFVGLGRIATNSMFHWMFYAPNLKRPDLQPIADCLSRQMYLGGRYWRPEYLSAKNFVWPTVIYTDEELRSVECPALLLIGQQEPIYRPEAYVARARKLLPHLQAEIIPRAAHDLPVSKSEVVNPKVLEFLGR